MSNTSHSHAQSTVLSNWSRLEISKRQTRKERAEFPRAIPHIFADARTLPVRLLKGKRLTRLVQYSGLAAIFLAATLTLTGCGSPLEPSVHAQEQPLHHNIPATFAGHPEGPVIYLCETQPRAYRAPDGRTLVERDHYLQYSHCPATPID